MAEVADRPSRLTLVLRATPDAEALPVEVPRELSCTALTVAERALELLLADPVERTAEPEELLLTERALPEVEDPEVERTLEEELAEPLLERTLELELEDPVLERVLLPLLVLVPLLLRRLSCWEALAPNELLEPELTVLLRELLLEPELIELLLRELEPELTELLLRELLLEPELIELLERVLDPELTELPLERLLEVLPEERVLLPEDWVLRVDCPVERELPPPVLRVWAIISGAMSRAKATITEPA